MAKKRFRLASVTLAPPERIVETAPQVMATRLFGESRYDSAIIGTVENPDGLPVLIYDWEGIEDVRAKEIISKTNWAPDSEGDYDSPEGSPWTLAAQELSREIGAAFPRSPHAVPAIASLALEELDSYPEDVNFYEVDGETWVSWTPEY